MATVTQREALTKTVDLTIEAIIRFEAPYDVDDDGNVEQITTLERHRRRARVDTLISVLSEVFAWADGASAWAIEDVLRHRAFPGATHVWNPHSRPRLKV